MKNMIDRDFLDRHYLNILIPNRDKILAGGTVDERLVDAVNDNRMSLVLLIRISPSVSENIVKSIEELKGIEPSMYYYPPEDFHITVMDILKGELYRKIPENLDSYAKAIKECSRQISPFTIEFDGLTASDGAVMVKGYYDNQLQIFRQMLRDSFKKNNLELQERYETVSSHISIARVKEKLSNPEGLLDYVSASHYFGKMQVENIELSFHNWYDTKKNLLENIKL